MSGLKDLLEGSRDENSAGEANGMEALVSGEPADSANQVDSVNQDDGVLVMGVDTIQDDQNDAKVIEDGGKEDMFVDCPDVLLSYDGKVSGVTGTSEAIEASEPHQGFEGNDAVAKTHFNESGNVRQGDDLKGELEHLQAMLEKISGEKESIAREYEAERRSLTQEIANFHRQLYALNSQQSLINENDGGFVDHYESEIWEGEKKSLESSALLQEMINDCSKFVKHALEERSKSEGTIKELQAILHEKDQEIEDLNARVAESSVLQDIEATASRVLTSLASTVNQEEISNESFTEKICRIENNTSLLIDKYNSFLSETDLLRQCIKNAGSEHFVKDEMATVFQTARGELVELRRKEVDLYQKVKKLEDENLKLAEQLNKAREMYGTTKEKLSLAVSKGKGVVQQRDLLKQSLADKTSELEKFSIELQEKSTALEAMVQQLDSLKQSLADKTSELEKCSIELQEKSNALEAAELGMEELVKSETLAVSLQEVLSERNTIIEKCEEILSESGVREELQSMDITERVRWLAHQKTELMGLSLEFHKMTNALSSIDFPANILDSNLESRMSWLAESFQQAKEEAANLQDVISRTEEAAHNEIDRLTASILAETQEKNYLQEEIEDLRYRYEGIAEKEHQVSLEKDQMIRMLYEASGIAMDGPDELQSDVAMIIDRCFGKLKEQASVSIESSHAEEETFERLQCLLYVRDQNATLFEKILEEELLDRSKVDQLENKMVVVSQELSDLKDEKASLQNDLSRTEERATLLREKLSMAVKKGKGLVQERENMKQLLDEKNASIQKLKLKLEQQEITLNDFREEINNLSTDVARIPKFKTDLTAVKEQRDQLERFLAESNSMLQRLIELIDSISLPDDSAVEEPVEKVKWLAGYLSECQSTQALAQEELENVKDEARILSYKLAEAQASMNSLQDELSVAKNSMSQLAEDKREVEVAKTFLEQELHKATEKASFETLKFSEVSASRKSLEDAVALAENNISVLLTEKEDARVAAEMELQKVKEEVSVLTSELAGAHETIKSLEDAMSQVQTNVSLLAEENNMAQVGRTNLENEIEKLKEEANSQARKLVDATSTVKSLEEAILKAENTISDLSGDKEDAAHEILDLKSQINACMQELGAKENAEREIQDLKSQLDSCIQELAGTRDSKENRSSELSGYLNNVQVLLKDDTLLSKLRQSFVKKIEGLKVFDHLLKDISDHFVEMDSDMLQKFPASEENYSALDLFPTDPDNLGNIEMVNGDLNNADIDNFTIHVAKTVNYLQAKNKFVADIFENSSSFMDNLITALSTKLVATKDKVTVMLEHIKYLKQELNSMETTKQTQESAIEMLESNITLLASACSDATQELEFEVENNLRELGSAHELGNLNHADGEDDLAKHQGELDSKYLETAGKLLSAARNVQKLIKQFQYVRTTMAATVENLQENLKESRLAFEKAVEEREFHQSRVFKLETDLEEMRLKLGEYQAKEDKWKEREAELTLVKEKEADDTLLSTSQMKSLIDKMNGIEIPITEFEVGELEPHDSDHVRKLFFIIDCVDGLQQQLTSLSHKSELQQSTLKNQVFEIANLKEEVAKHIRGNQETEKMKHELFELGVGLENIIQKFGGDDEIVGIQKSTGVMGLVPILEKLVTATILESDKSKSKAEELDAKMLQTEEVVDELSSKVKLLEESKQGKEASPDSIQERGIFEAHASPNRSEISEIEDVGPLVNVPIPSAPSNAHVRSLRKGSSDHLAINIDSESNRLIETEDTDDDKGHMFRSINTLGFIPRQGRMLADRIDGIWVSGDRALMSRPRARLGLIAYWLFLNLWLLGTIL